MRLLKNKWFCMLLSILLIVTTLPVPAFAAKPEVIDSTSIKIMIKYKDTSKSKEQVVQSNVKDKKFKSIKKTISNDTYLAEVSNTQFEELKKDTNIQYIEVDAIVSLLEDEMQVPEPICTHCSEEDHVHSDEHECLESCLCQSCTNGLSEICECTECNCEDNLENLNEDVLSGETTEIPEQFDEVDLSEFDGLDTGNNVTNSYLGDQYGWNVSRTKIDVLHNQDYLGNGVKVAIFDTGVNTTSGDIDLAGGISFVEGVTYYSDDNGHGTKMASILSANLNGQGIAGVAPNIDLYSVKVLDQNGVGRYSSVLNGVEWAIENNIQIITMSFGGHEYSDILREAINRAVSNNILVVAAAGNAGENTLYYPAAFNDVIAVGATDTNNDLASFSNYGEGLSLVAPGTEMLAYGLDGLIENVQGTSASVQQVAGAAALLLGVEPGLTNGQLKFLLFANTFVKEDYSKFGHGILDVEKANQNRLTGEYSLLRYDTNGNEYQIPGDITVGGNGILVTQAACYHTYSNTCDKICNECGYVRSITHSYSNNCDPNCNVCNGSRPIQHTYSNSCDAYCNVCGGGGRTTAHSYTNNCDASCNVCGVGRTISHSYTNSCDSSCNVCGYSRTVTHSFTGGNCKTLQKCSVCGINGSSYGSHTWYNSGGYQSTHPHYGYDICSTCNATRVRTDVNTKPTCCICTNTNHNFSNSCDTTCNTSGCSATQSPSHVYNYPCSSSCSQCSNGARSVSHNYTETSKVHYSSTQDKVTETCTYCRIERISYVSCGCHSHNYSTKVVTQTHTPAGHYYYWECSCNETVAGGYQLLTTCLSCTTPPSVSFALPLAGQYYSENTGVLFPQIQIRDNENDVLTCKYFIDNSTTPVATQTVNNTSVLKLVTFTTGYNVSNLNEGTHTIKVEVSDGISPIGVATQSFIVDKSIPNVQDLNIQAFNNGFFIQVQGYDVISKLHSLPFQVAIPEVGYDSGWTAADTFTPSGMFIPNTPYTIVIKGRDILNHINEFSIEGWTLPGVPQISVSNIDKQTATLYFNDQNPNQTLYEIKVGNQYLNASGVLSPYPTDVILNAKTLVINGLTPGSTYSVSARAKANDGSYTTKSETINFVTVPSPPLTPSVIGTSWLTQINAVVEWSHAVGATSYTLNINGIDVLTDSEDLEYYFEDLTPNTSYTIKVKANNSGGSSDWSVPFEFKTLPILGLNAIAEPGKIKLTWELISGLSSYEILINDSQLHQTTTNIFDVMVNSPDVLYSFQIRGINDNGIGAFSAPVVMYSLANVATELVVSNESSNALTLTWQANSNPESIQYQVEAIESINGVAVENGYKKTNNWTYSLTEQMTGLKPNQEYLITVRSRNSVGIETHETTSAVGKTLEVVPESPINIVSTSTDAKISLKWDPVYNASHYKIYRDGILLTDTVTTNNYSDTGAPSVTALDANTEYTYIIYAVNMVGESAPSMAVKKRTLPQMPAMPFNVAVTSSLTSIQLNWDSVANATGYDVEFNGSIMNSGSENHFVMNGLEAGESYTYRIRSRNEGGKSSWTELKNALTLMTLPDIPSGLDARSSDKTIQLTWGKATNAEQYQIELNGIELDIVNKTAYEINNLEPSTNYAVRVRAMNASGESDWSTLMEILTQEEVTGAPSLVNVTTGQNTVLIEWNAIENATDYVVMLNDMILSEHHLETNYLLNSLDSGTAYDIKIGVNQENNETIFGNKIVVFTLPMTPELVQNKSTPVSIDLEWSAVVGATGYVIEVNERQLDLGNVNRYIVNFMEIEELNLIRIRAYNQGGMSEWSPYLEVARQEIFDLTPMNINVESTQNTAVVTWDLNQEVEYYEYILGDSEPVVIQNAFVELSGLTANSEYTFKIRAVENEGYALSDWSETVTFNTLHEAPIAPEELIFTAESNQITLSWSEVEDATGYEVMIDGIIVNVGHNTMYLDAGLSAESEHKYQVRSIINSVRSVWTEEQIVYTQVGIPGVPTNIVGTSTLGRVAFRWSPVAGATSYSLEIEGQVDPIVTDQTEYAFNRLDEGTVIKVRISAIVDDLQSPFSTSVSCSSGLMTPENINTEILDGTVKIKWDSVNSATLYEIEADGIIVGTTSINEFTFEDFRAGTAKSIRIRSKNDFSAKSDWSEPMLVHSSPMETIIAVESNEIFEMTLRAENIEDFSNYTFTIEYNADELDVIDLYSLTKAIELGTGNVQGTDMRILSFESGKIVFKISTAIQPGKVWSGVITVIKLRSLLTGQSTITYKIQ